MPDKPQQKHRTDRVFKSGISLSPKRYRVDTEKLQLAVAKEFAAKREKTTRAKPKTRNKTTA